MALPVGMRDGFPEGDLKRDGSRVMGTKNLALGHIHHDEDTYRIHYPPSMAKGRAGWQTVFKKCEGRRSTAAFQGWVFKRVCR